MKLLLFIGAYLFASFIVILIYNFIGRSYSWPEAIFCLSAACLLADPYRISGKDDLEEEAADLEVTLEEYYSEHPLINRLNILEDRPARAPVAHARMQRSTVFLEDPKPEVGVEVDQNGLLSEEQSPLQKQWPEA